MQVKVFFETLPIAEKTAKNLTTFFPHPVPHLHKTLLSFFAFAYSEFLCDREMLVAVDVQMQIVEFDTPQNLLQDTNSAFRAMFQRYS